MAIGEDEFDRLAFALVNSQFDFDAVEHEGYRAEWADDGSAVVVENVGTGETVSYTADDVVVATSDREMRDARWPENAQGESPGRQDR